MKSLVDKLSDATGWWAILSMAIAPLTWFGYSTDVLGWSMGGVIAVAVVLLIISFIGVMAIVYLRAAAGESEDTNERNDKILALGVILMPIIAVPMAFVLLVMVIRNRPQN